MTAKHTEWTYTGYADHCQVGTEYREILDAGGFEIANQTGILTAESAKLTVKAVNSHDQLSKACKGLLDILADIATIATTATTATVPEDMKSGWVRKIDSAKAAIAAAEGTG